MPVVMGAGPTCGEGVESTREAEMAMLRYEYRCVLCGNEFEREVHAVPDDGPACPDCGEPKAEQLNMPNMYYCKDCKEEFEIDILVEVPPRCTDCEGQNTHPVDEPLRYRCVTCDRAFMADVFYDDPSCADCGKGGSSVVEDDDLHECDICGHHFDPGLGESGICQVCRS